MKIVKAKKCPKCGGEDVIDTGDKTGNIEEFSSYESVSAPTIPIFRCKNCEESFKLKTCAR